MFKLGKVLYIKIRRKNWVINILVKEILWKYFNKLRNVGYNGDRNGLLSFINVMGGS